ncbi:hypothetical protein M413DRAFT_437813, partial [Hebeloma cylindrosporum]
TTTRSQIPVANLKERIAALEQRTSGIGAPNERPTSPITNGNTSSNAVPPATGFRDKIAKFERKGGVPVPRGRFGLGAPPASEGPRRQGELYGNRIPAPARTVSGSMLPVPTGRATSPTSLGPTPPPGYSAGDRRSFSASSVISDVDDGMDYTPITSPTFAFPPDSPESTLSAIVRGTSFQRALEIARKTESAKQEAQQVQQQQAEDATTPTARQRSPDNEEEVVGMVQPTPPAILLSAEEPVPIVVLHNSPTVDLSPSELIATPISTPSAVSSSEGSSVHEPEPVGVKEETTRRDLPTVERVPSVTRIPRKSVSKVEKIKVAEILDPIVPTSSPANIEDEKVEEPTEQTITISATSPEVAIVASPLPEPPNVVIVEGNKVVTPNLPPPEIVETASEPLKEHDTPKAQPLELPPPSIVVHDDQTSTYEANSGQPDGANKRAEISSRKAALTLDPEPLNSNSLMSPPAVSGSMSAMSLTDVLTSYFTGGTEAAEQSFRSSTPPPLPAASPLSPAATLAYDAPETPPRPANVNPPDPQSFLSPPATGFLSAAPSSGNSSMGSVSSLGSRPISMIEMSPSRVTRATKMTPATSRGVPVFLPPNTGGARKSDFVYFPPTPDAEQTDFGSAVLHKPSRSMTDLADVSEKDSKTFTAVVHGKVKEAEKPKRLPETPYKGQRATVLEAPVSPGQGELAALLQGALWLEDSLDRGELPSETPDEAVEEEKLKEEARRVAAEAEAKAQEEEKKKIAIAKAQLQAKRDEPTSGKLKHTFLIPLTKARSAHHRKEVSSSKAETKQREDPGRHPKSAGLPDKSGAGHANAQSAAAGSAATQQNRPRSTTPENRNAAPPKSPKSSRFASFRRMGSISRPSTVYGHPPRHSESVSSEDSVPVVTPPENNLEFGTKKSSAPVTEFGQIPENGSTTSFPSISPKKSVRSLGRATSFAERIWSRARTKSSGSNLSATSENGPEEPPKLPSLNSPPAIEIPQLPNFLNNDEAILHQPPQRSTSLMYLDNQRPTQSFEPLPPLPIITTTSSYIQAPPQSTPLSSHSLLPPNTSDSTRPSSWTSSLSLSSAGSLPSPLFDKSIFDAFPSVPGTTPAPSLSATFHQNQNHRRDKSVPMTASAATNSFDSALLSSAIHLVASSAKGGTTANASASRDSMPTTLGRKSGETAH